MAESPIFCRRHGNAAAFFEKRPTTSCSNVQLGALWPTMSTSILAYSYWEKMNRGRMSASAKSGPELELVKGGATLRRSAVESSNCDFVVFGGDVALPCDSTARLVLYSKCQAEKR